MVVNFNIKGADDTNSQSIHVDPSWVVVEVSIGLMSRGGIGSVHSDAIRVVNLGDNSNSVAITSVDSLTMNLYIAWFPWCLSNIYLIVISSNVIWISELL